MWPARSSGFSIAARASSELSERAPQSASFLYIVVLCQPRLVGLSRFQYYLDCDRTFVLFDFIEPYTCEAQLHYLTKPPGPRLLPVELYPSCREVKDPPVNPLRSVPRDPLQYSFILFFLFNLNCASTNFYILRLEHTLLILYFLHYIVIKSNDIFQKRDICYRYDVIMTSS